MTALGATPGCGDGRLVVAQVRAVLADRVLEGATVVCEGGRIVEVAPRSRTLSGAVDGGGCYLLPGLVDTHSDGLEKERAPRSSSTLDEEFALRSFEGRLWAAGITTVFHGLAFEENPAYGRTIALANRLWEVIQHRRVMPATPVDHRLLYRLEARSAVGLSALVSKVEEEGVLVDGSPQVPPLVSLEDHTPGQGQYRDIERFVEQLRPERVPGGLSPKEYTEQLVEGARRADQVAARNRERLAELARAGVIRLLAHDVADRDGVVEATGWGAAVAEFPLTLEAARTARDHGLGVVAGAPNVLRGASHSGNVSARELVAAGACTALASDYLPSSLLAAAFLLARTGACDLPAAVGLVTAGPAEVTGLVDRGRLAPGLRADLVLVEQDGGWPRVRAVTRAGRFLGALTAPGHAA
jgi:alpha-D-ribose 1-methylphosphonate 5-triphosphate diphosphatase